MEENDNERVQPATTRVVIEAETLDGVVEAIGADRVAGERAGPDLDPAVETLAEVYEGVRRATEDDARGRSRKVVGRYAGREDLDGEVVGAHLRVLAAHGLVVRDGNRWRLPEPDDG